MIGVRRTRAGLLAVLMLLLTLSVVALVPAGAEHHHTTAVAAEEAPHDHHTGPAPRLRPATGVTGGGIVVGAAHAPTAVDLVVIAGRDSRGDEASTSVLRV